jgi:hypothetical protein
MSSEELVNAYLEGGVSRRAFIRRLVAGGISLGAAVSYAHLLSPDRSQAASAHAARDFYTPAGIDVQILSRDISRVAKKGKLKLQVSSDEAADIDLTATLPRRRGPLTLGSTRVSLASAGTLILKLALTEASKKVLQNRDKAKVTVTASGRDRQLAVSADLVTQKLK